MSDSGSRPLFLLDGNSLLFRAFFALPPDLATSSGLVTNALHGFVTMLVSILRDQQPGGLAVAWDRREPTFRDSILDDYKGGRPPTPELLSPQFPQARRLLDALGIVSVDALGFEADDVLATIATWARDASEDVVVVTGDRDSFQLVEDPYVKVLYTRKGLSDTVLYDESGIAERTGVKPADYPFLAALRGDPSDNLPGVPGVGEKTAAKLVNAYRDVETLYAHVDDQTPKLRENLLASTERVRQNLQVIPLVRDVPLDLSLDDLHLGRWNVEATREVFADLELRSAWRRLEPFLGSQDAAGAGPGISDTRTRALDAPDLSSIQPRIPSDSRELLELIGGLERAGTVAISALWEGDPGRSAIVGLCLARVGTPTPAPEGTTPQDAATPQDAVDEASDQTRLTAQGALPVPLWIEAEALSEPEVVSALAALLGPGGLQVVAHHAKELMRSLLPLGIDIVDLDLDTAVAGYLLDPGAGQYRLEDLVDRLLDISIDGDDPTVPTGQFDLGGDDPLDVGASPAADVARRVVALTLVAEPTRAALEQFGVTRLYQEVERPLVRVLARMEVAGIGVDVDELRRLVSALTSEAERLESEVHRLAGETFNVNSTPQLRTVLYERLGLTPGRKTKTGYSTDAATLERLRGQHPVVETLLKYREVEKLRSTYGESLLAEVGPDGRIHATFSQTVARTGRLSSDRPNLHNIPVRTEEGRQLRRAFVPAEGHSFLVADYDQIELRVIAHLSGDPGLMEAFEAGQDIHRATAARVFGVDPSEVTSAQRSRAKMVSYGLAYGMEAFGLAQRLGVDVPEAQGILDAFFAGFPAVREYMERSVATARRLGYSETLFGRRRPLPDLASTNHHLRQSAERQAMNAVIQGLAADLFKVALVRLDQSLTEGVLKSKVVLQVHDEVVLEVPRDEHDMAGSLIPSVLEQVGDSVQMTLPLQVSVSWGDSWAEAKGG